MIFFRVYFLNDLKYDKNYFIIFTQLKTIKNKRIVYFLENTTCSNPLPHYLIMINGSFHSLADSAKLMVIEKLFNYFFL